MTMNNEFYKIVNEEILNRAEMEGDQVILRDPALDAKRQIEQIEEMLAMDVDVLVVTPVDGKRLSEVLNRAKGQGVYIVVVDTNLEDERLADCTITSDNYSAGCLVGQYFLKENQYEVAYLIFKDDESSKKYFENEKKYIKNNMDEFYKYNYIGLNSYGRFTVTSKNKYIKILRLKNSIVCIFSNKEAKKEVDNLIKELNY